MARESNAVFRFLSRLFVALLALLALRIFFAAARRANRGAAGSGDREVGGAKGAARSTKATRPPRIDRGAAEDVPYVEVEPEHARRS